MAQKKVRAAIVSQEKLAEGIFSMWLDAPEMAEASRPGQFIAVYTNDPSKLLPRPSVSVKPIRKREDCASCTGSPEPRDSGIFRIPGRGYAGHHGSSGKLVSVKG